MHTLCSDQHKYIHHLPICFPFYPSLSHLIYLNLTLSHQGLSTQQEIYWLTPSWHLWQDNVVKLGKQGKNLNMFLPEAQSVFDQYWALPVREIMYLSKYINRENICRLLLSFRFFRNREGMKLKIIYKLVYCVMKLSTIFLSSMGLVGF